ncbi:MAG: right-handed parallel beta-helix repeat-containing protein [Planctomycetota bacterium]|nr:right-handed parallel beta-helix repeat-containing protein [Planctomycetota bacterium]
MRMRIVGLILAGTMMTNSAAAAGREIFVAPGGSDANPGTREKPLATVAAAQAAARKARADGAVSVILREGTYYLDKTLVLGPEDSGRAGATVAYAAAEGERAVLSGGVKMELAWRDYKGPVKQASVPKGFTTDQFFVNGQSQRLARYPNYNPKQRIFGGYAADAFSPARAARWANPAGGFIHAMHLHTWGGFHYRITGKKPDGTIEYEGGWQNNRPMGMHGDYRFVEGIFEELDAPGEWFLDSRAGVIYFYPPDGLDLAKATFEGVRLAHLVEVRGTREKPAEFLTLRGLTFRHAARTFMETREPLHRSDWTISRGGAVFLAGARDCSVEDCEFDQTGGNAVFVSGHARRVSVRGCFIHDVGASGVCFVGEASAVRRGVADATGSVKDIDLTPGPANEEYVADCLVEDCLMERCGRVEKQVAGVQISRSARVTVRHCSIYEMPRAGINISEGTWGGHVIEGCDVFDTVLETGDHGSFNSWGRDRYWGLTDVDLNAVLLGDRKGLPLLDAVETTVIRDSRWRCDHGWDIDLDDGSTNYHIYNNLCLHGGIKLREGYRRVVENNVIATDSLHPHVWFGASENVFRRNVVAQPYKPIGMPAWGKAIDANLLHVPGQVAPSPAKALQAISQADEHSLAGDARFLDPGAGDYRVAENSPARGLGFVNFDMTSFGVRKPSLRAIARTPALPAAGAARPTPASDAASWLGATVKSMQTEGEKSATGMFAITGVLFVTVPPASKAASLGFSSLTVVTALNGTKISTLKDFLAYLDKTPSGTKITASVWAGQKAKTITWVK